MEFKRWMRAPYVAKGETRVRFDESSNNTLSMEKLESSSIISEIDHAGTFVRSYIKRYPGTIARMNDPTRELVPLVRKECPALDGRGNPHYIISDTGIKKLIYRALQGKKTAPGELYDEENERAAGKRPDGKLVLSRETSKTYRKHSKPPTRQMKQGQRGRPKKDSTAQ